MDKDRVDEKLHKYIHINRSDKITLVDTKVGGDLFVSKNIETDTLNVKNIGIDNSGLDASGFASFSDLSTNSLKVYGDAFITGTLEINNVLRKTLTDIDITGDLNLDNKLDVSGLFTTHGGMNIIGSGELDKINNATIGYDVSGRGAFTDLSCTVLNAAAIILVTLDNCIIGSINPTHGAFTDLSANIFKIGDASDTAFIITKGDNNLELKTGSSDTGFIKINQGPNSNIHVNPHGTGRVVLPIVDISGGDINHSDLSNNNIYVSTGKIIDVSSATFHTSFDQKSEILVNGALNNTSNIDIQDYNFRAQSITVDGLPQNRIVYTGTDGILSTEAGFEYNPETNELKTTKIGSFTSTGAIDFNNQFMTNIDVNSGTIDGTTIRTSDITVAAGKTLDVQYGTFVTSIPQDVSILHRACQNNNNDIDFQAYGIRAYNVTADSLASGKVIYTSLDGLLTVEPEFQYDPSENLLTVGKISSFRCNGNVDFFDNSAINIDVYQGKILQSDVSDSNLTLTSGYFVDVSQGILKTSTTQDSTIFKSGAANNDSNIDIGNYNFRANSINADGLTSGQVVYTGDSGLLTTEPGFEYNTTANTMTIQNITCNGLFSLSQAINTITAANQIPSIDINYTKTALVTTASDNNFSLPDSAEGHIIFIYLKTKGGTDSAIITPINFHNGTSMNLSLVGNNATLMFIDNKWILTSTYGGIVT